MGIPARHRLRDTLKRLIDTGRTSWADWLASEAITNGSLGRVVSEEGQSLTLDKLDRLAEALGCEPWQLLHPDGEIATFSKDALKIARKMDSLRPEARGPAYALWVQRVDFENESGQPAEAESPNARDTQRPIRLRHVSK